MNLLSLFSGCGGMDIGFEGDFKCLKKSINSEMHPSWIKKIEGEWVTVAPTIFKTVFANDIRQTQKRHGCLTLERQRKTLMRYTIWIVL